eukprot:1866405-Rhodomonas_salina.4
MPIFVGFRARDGRPKEPQMGACGGQDMKKDGADPSVRAQDTGTQNSIAKHGGGVQLMVVERS